MGIPLSVIWYYLPNNIIPSTPFLLGELLFGLPGAILATSLISVPNTDFPEFWANGQDYELSYILCYAALGNVAWDNSSDIFNDIAGYAVQYNMPIYAILNHYLYSSTDDESYLLSYAANDIESAPFQGPMFHPQTTFPFDDNYEMPGWEGY